MRLFTAVANGGGGSLHDYYRLLNTQHFKYNYRLNSKWTVDEDLSSAEEFDAFDEPSESDDEPSESDDDLSENELLKLQIINKIGIEYYKLYPGAPTRRSRVEEYADVRRLALLIAYQNVNPRSEIYTDVFDFIEDTHVDDIPKLVNLFKTNQKDILIRQIDTWATTTREVFPGYNKEWNPGAPDHANRIYIILKPIIG